MRGSANLFKKENNHNKCVPIFLISHREGGAGEDPAMGVMDCGP